MIAEPAVPPVPALDQRGPQNRGPVRKGGGSEGLATFIADYNPVVADGFNPGAFVVVPTEPAADVAVDHVAQFQGPHDLTIRANTYSVFGTAITVSKLTSESSSKLQ